MARTVQVFKSPKPSATKQQTGKHDDQERTRVCEGTEPEQARISIPACGNAIDESSSLSTGKELGIYVCTKTSPSIARIWSEREQQPPRRRVMHGWKRLPTGAAARCGGAVHSPLSTAVAQHSAKCYATLGLPGWTRGEIARRDGVDLRTPSVRAVRAVRACPPTKTSGANQVRWATRILCRAHSSAKVCVRWMRAA